LRDAADLAVRIGAGSLANAAFDHLRATGARPRRLPLRGVDALTVSERRVVDLAARGDTNSAIATALFVNMKTVESHLLRAYRKLGIRTRSELAVLLNSEGEQLGDVVR
jgi:DNA-binding CsgD family transcriptional regulator